MCEAKLRGILRSLGVSDPAAAIIPTRKIDLGPVTGTEARRSHYQRGVERGSKRLPPLVTVRRTSARRP